MFVLVYGYSLTFEYAAGLRFLRGQALLFVLLSAGFLCIPRVLFRDEDPWLERSELPRGAVINFAAPVVICGLMLSSLAPQSVVLPRGDTVRLATYNINGGYDGTGVYRLERIAQTIEASVADVVVLQEVDTGRPVSYGVDMLEFLSRRLDMEHVYQPTVESVRGIAILSPWPISNPEAIFLPSNGEQQAALRVTITDPRQGRTFTLIAVQMEAGEEAHRIEQLAVLFTLIGDQEPLVVAGDLAAPPQDVVYQQMLAAGFLDPDLELGVDRGFTTPARLPAFRHDYVLMRGLSPLSSLQSESTASDHRMVVVDLGWPAAESGPPELPTDPTPTPQP
ncbi:MAG: hypothetical protein GYB68_15900, partial [Chloroflexi bacterium]|nr:hypothetical protein [Chloroflexota bacterium]